MCTRFDLTKLIYDSQVFGEWNSWAFMADLGMVTSADVKVSPHKREAKRMVV